ncbi:hypothetical protein LEP1GSC096_2910 [Leptospira interrogans serovar Hebdomadis str. R499]|uniref:Uncharacterized protein n=1 Tax=Leptospira interrogans str. UI 12758 TaxID=1049938 RepID=A0A0E2D8Q8_LEPIR|nr:hypothetical protein LEP1GSC045_1527 [Leptospira interrogans serovar Pomona str. Kennewicki LC82-25]EKN95803.1 hypothetical protein LEP1GSC014_1877 [Leptospira interrogans serovar Pomona str. Pomona]EKO67919.1 hypothetical protein LEP1GSC069_1425 [Leptospira interrogans serovar Canicola str. Fiocruz LV133]EKR34125.1 hypothetical protein LEP1GSC096_2910 [Leptospira interrogans serovar Hebdomadis str. R499]EKR56482.1 hypothetical protein LEP1GSC105_4392 [Leptospira interrogans str. UI 12758]E
MKMSELIQTNNNKEILKNYKLFNVTYFIEYSKKQNPS